MGRHSAPDDDTVGVDLVDPIAADGTDDAPTGRHARIAAEAAAVEARAVEARAAGGRGAARVRPAPERLVERTGVIPQAEVDDAARDDAVERTLRGPRPAELLPVLPGEAIVPPTDDEPLGPEIAESVPTAAQTDGVAVLDAVLADGEVDEVGPVEGEAAEAGPAAVEPPDTPAPAVEAMNGVDDRPSRPLPRARVEPDTVEPETDEPEAVEPAVADGAGAADPAAVAAPDTTVGPVPVPAGDQHPAVAVKRRPLHHGAAATSADLALLRGDRALLARTLTAFLTPFLLYAIALVVAGAGSRTYLVWIWIPAIVACVGAGSLLDVAHKKVTVPPDVPIAAATELTGPIDVVPSAAADAPAADAPAARETDTVSGS